MAYKTACGGGHRVEQKGLLKRKIKKRDSTGCAALAAAGGKDAATLIQGVLSGGALGLFKLPVPVGSIP